MFVVQISWPAVAILIEPVLRTIGRWAAGYLLLSLSLALVWVAIVSIAQSRRNRRGWNAAWSIPPRTATLARGFHHWQQRGSDAFVSGLENLAARDRNAQ